MGAELKRAMGGPGALRLILALSVFANHISSAGIGPAAVYVFFALSGFWIYRMWLSKYAGTRSPLVTYYVSRYWRLAPLFILAGLVTSAGDVLMQRHIEWTAATALSSVTILGYASLPVRPVTPAWSLDIEAQFYLIAPLLVAILQRVAPALILIAALAASAVAATLGLANILPPYLAFFVVGMLAARTDWGPSRALVWIPLAAIAVVSVALLASPWRSVILGGAHPGQWYTLNPAYNVVLGVCVIPYALSTTTRRGCQFDGAFADLSYAVYLLHWVAARWLSNVGAGHSAIYRLPFAAFAIIATLAASWCAWRFYDRPINAIRAAWVRSRASSTRSDVANATRIAGKTAA